jgi:hypothetical protein
MSHSGIRLDDEFNGRILQLISGIHSGGGSPFWHRPADEN